MLTLIYFILILGIVIFVHELGHFIFAKRAGIFVHEFALGMGPKIFSFKRKQDPTLYSLRLFPIGGFVSIAGEGSEQDKKVKKSEYLQNKSWGARFSAIIAGVSFNFIFALVLLFIIGLIWGAPVINVSMGNAANINKYPAYQAGLRAGDVITKLNNHKVSSWEDFLIRLEPLKGEEISVTYTTKENKVKKIKISPIKEKDEYVYGFIQGTQVERGIWPSLKFSGLRFVNLIKTLFLTVGGLFNGNIPTSSLAGPVGIYQIVGQSAEVGLGSVLYLIAFLSINIGFINLIPFPAFDGGRLLFLIIEKIKGKPVNQEIENWLHSIGFVLLIALMILVTWNDIVRLFGGK